MLAVGQFVTKISGYEYTGTVVSVFENLAGQTRVVVENDASRGMLHIFNPEQMKILWSDTTVTRDSSVEVLEPPC